MKKWMYVISVSCLLAVFLSFYLPHMKDVEAREKVRQEEVAQKLKADAAHKAEIEAKARADAEKRAAQRAAEDKKKEDERVAKWEAQGKEIQDATDKHNAEADRLSKQASELEIQLSALRAQKEKLNRDTFELAKKVELARIARQNAEIESQRMVTMIANRADSSSLTKLPPPPPEKS
jgi:chromosome segregation ATPase